MKNLLISLMLVLSMPLYASAFSFDYNYSFSGSDENGTGSATMHVTVDDFGTQLVASVLNTSPLTTSGGQTNSPGIDGFGFFIDQINPGDTGDAVAPGVASWSLSAYSTNGTNTPANLLTIGSNSMASGWELQYQPGNVNGTFFLDYNATNGSGVDMALYNPAVTTGTSPNPYYTEAILTINLLDVLTFGDDSGAYVRMQNVGLRGEGSLKLFDYYDGDGGEDEIPEPSTLVLLGLGLVGLAAYRRKKH